MSSSSHHRPMFSSGSLLNVPLRVASNADRTYMVDVDVHANTIAPSAIAREVHSHYYNTRTRTHTRPRIIPYTFAVRLSAARALGQANSAQAARPIVRMWWCANNCPQVLWQQRLWRRSLFVNNILYTTIVDCIFLH